uniref:Uncharacterized protein n=1 Tax=Arion vulgaris TaxID=1028688 RepID=A0A0B6Z8Z0_9EUPU
MLYDCQVENDGDYDSRESGNGVKVAESFPTRSCTSVVKETPGSWPVRNVCDHAYNREYSYQR